MYFAGFSPCTSADKSFTIISGIIAIILAVALLYLLSQLLPHLTKNTNSTLIKVVVVASLSVSMLAVIILLVLGWYVLQPWCSW